MTDPAFIPDDFFKVLAPSDIFGTDGPFEVDLGCGDGGFLLQLAAHYPERRFLSGCWAACGAFAPGQPSAAWKT